MFPVFLVLLKYYFPPPPPISVNGAPKAVPDNTSEQRSKDVEQDYEKDEGESTCKDALQSE